MAEFAAASGIIGVPVPAGLALFADATAVPTGLDARELATAAGEAVAVRTGRPVPVLFARQEHTRLAFSFGAEGPLAPGPHAVGVCDALLTTEPFVALTVRTADCLPIVMAGGGAVAMVHAGWRGLAADILGTVVSRMGSEYGVPPSAIDAVIGVGVGPCHYRVGDEVLAALGHHAVDGDEWRLGEAVDLARWARGRLTALDVGRERVRVLPGCTACSARYHSYRRDGTNAGRQWSAVVLTPGPTL